jgi:hypothetical protein
MPPNRLRMPKPNSHGEILLASSRPAGFNQKGSCIHGVCPQAESSSRVKRSGFFMASSTGVLACKHQSENRHF